MTTATRPRTSAAGRTGRRGLFRLAGAGAVAAAVAAACSDDPKPKTAAPPSSASTGTAGGSPAAQAAPKLEFPSDQRVRVQHLLRRAGFAPSEAEVQHGLDVGEAALIDELLAPEQRPDGLSPRLQALEATDELNPQTLTAWWMERMAATATPSLEKVTLFWHGFHTSGFDKVGGRNASLMYGQNVFQRGSAFGRFGDILKGISRQPAMMLYLDTVTNVKGHPNENFARELMELFSMGVDNYSETDVREAARAFTGYSLNRQAGEFVFRQPLHDAGQKTVLGHTGAFSGDDVIDIIMAQPVTAQYVARKAWSFFAYPNPDDATIAPVATAFTSSGGDMRATLKAVFTHPAFTSGQAYRALVKSPIEYAVGAVRQLGAHPDGLGVGLARWGQLMGQVPFAPPNVAGWPGGSAWLGSGSWFARVNGINTLLAGGRVERIDEKGKKASLPNQPSSTPGAGAAVPRPKQVEQATAALNVDRYLDEHKLVTAGALVDHLLALLVDGQATPNARAALVDYAASGGGDGASLSAMAAAERDRRVRGAVYLIMAGPQYQLA